MRLLVVHQNFPGQFGHLVQAWSARPGWEVRGLGRDTALGLAGFDSLMRYRLSRDSGDQQHPYLRRIEAATLHGQAAARAMLQARREGFRPDVIVAHPGWGETLYAKDVYPAARLIHYCEWYYASQGADVGFDPEFPTSLNERARLRNWNALHALNLTQCDVGVTPTEWQRSRHPAPFRDRIVVQHEGIATSELGPDPRATLAMPGGGVLKAGDAVITYVARNLEPYRGFHIFMRALERLQQRHPTLNAVIVGGDEVSYGRPPPSGARHWRDHMLGELKIDLARTHFLGRVSRETFVRVLRISQVHLYMTYPFVLSWSMLEAMACGALVIASDTEPVREVIRDGINGRLVPFFDVDAIVRCVEDVLREPGHCDALRRQARHDAAAYCQGRGLAGYDALLVP